MKHIIIGLSALIFSFVVVIVGAHVVGFLLAHLIGGDRKMYTSIILCTLMAAFVIGAFLMETKGHHLKSIIEFTVVTFICLSPFVLAVTIWLMQKAVIYFQR